MHGTIRRGERVITTTGAQPLDFEGRHLRCYEMPAVCVAELCRGGWLQLGVPDDATLFLVVGAPEVTPTWVYILLESPDFPAVLDGAVETMRLEPQRVS